MVRPSILRALKSSSRSLLGILIISAILLSGCKKKDAAIPREDFDFSVLNAKIETGCAAIDPIEAYSWELISQAVQEWNGYRKDFFITDAVMEGLELLASYDSLVTDGTVQIWRLDYRLSPNDPYLVPDVNGTVLDEERRITNTSYLGERCPVAIVTDGEAQILGYLYTSEKNPVTLIHSLCAFLQEQGITYSYQVDETTFTGWKALYWDFFQNHLAGYQDLITGIGLYYLAQLDIPALTVYSASPSGDSCEIYLIEDNEVRCLTGPSKLAALADPDSLPMLLAPASVHALGDQSQMTPENREQYEQVDYSDCIVHYPAPEDWGQGAFFQELRLAEYTVSETPSYVLLNILVELPVMVTYTESEFNIADDGYIYAADVGGNNLYVNNAELLKAYYKAILLHHYVTYTIRDRGLAIPGLPKDSIVTPEQYALDITETQQQMGSMYNANTDFGLLAKESTGTYRVLGREDYGLLSLDDPASSLLELLDLNR